MLPYTAVDALEAMAREGYAEGAPTWTALLPGGEPGPSGALAPAAVGWRRIVGGVVRRLAAGPRGMPGRVATGTDRGGA